MTYDDETLNGILDRTSGHCTYCDKQLARKNYGTEGERGAWEVDHSLPISRDGTDHLNNLFPACIDCNRAKGDMTGREFKALIQREAADRGVGLAEIAVAAAAVGGLLYLLGRGRPPGGPSGPGVGRTW